MPDQPHQRLKRPRCAAYAVLDAAPDEDGASPSSVSWPARNAGRILEAVEGGTSPTVAVLGRTFKADADDLRQSPALAITEHVAAAA